MPHDRHRRQLLLASPGLGAAALLARQARAQASDAAVLPDFPAELAGKEHRRVMRETGEALQGHSPLSEEGMTLLVADLERRGAITEQEASVLRRLARTLFQSDRLQAMRDDIDVLAKDASGPALAVIEIARDSVLLAIETLEGLPWDIMIPVVAADVSGALKGAGILARFGPVAAKYGAVVGGAGGSMVRYFDLKGLPKVPA